MSIYKSIRHLQEVTKKQEELNDSKESEEEEDSDSSHPYEEIEFEKEKKDQKYLGILALCFAISLCPVTILR